MAVPSAEFVDTKDAAKILGVHSETLRVWRNTRLFGVCLFDFDVKIGKSYYYKRERVMQLKSVYQKELMPQIYHLAEKSYDIVITDSGCVVASSELITTKDAALLLNVPSKYFEIWRNRKLFGVPFFQADAKIGRKWYYKRERIMQLKSVYQEEILQNMYKMDSNFENISENTSDVLLKSSEVAKKLNIDVKILNDLRKNSIFVEDKVDKEGIFWYKKQRIENLKRFLQVVQKDTAPSDFSHQSFQKNTSKPDMMLANYADMELELLGMCILKEGKAVADVAAILQPDDFYSYEHQLIFTAILDLCRTGTPPTMPTIADWLKRKNYIFKGEGNTVSPYDKVRLDTIMDLGQAAFSTAYAVSYALRIKEVSNRNKLVRLGKELVSQAPDFAKDFSSLIVSSQKALLDISGTPAQIQYLKRQQYFEQFYEKDSISLQLYSRRKTGFANIDAYQIFSPGLYVIGATPAAGKTTFCWQLLEQLAKNGESCFFCSYEMAALELYSKSMAREIFLRDRQTSLTSADIRYGATSNALIEVFADFLADTDGGVRLFELRDENIDDLLRTLRPLCNGKGKSPVVCLDYLQIVPPSSDLRLNTEKMRIDDIVHKLKTFQRETNTTFIVISSFNRLNYYQQVSFESFKESGNIEYTADVVWAFQLHVSNEIKAGTDTSAVRKKFDAAKRAQPRHVQLKCLKNRQGQNYDCFFNYFSAHDFFQACENWDI